MNLSELLKRALELKASDLHLAPNQVPIVRIDGALLFLQQHAALTSDQIKNDIYSLLTDAQQKQFALELEIDFAYDLENISRFRINAFHQQNGIAAVFRLIANQIPTLQELNLPPIFESLVSLNNGLILITGPTGSGKSTTLAAMIQHINSHFSKHILTIEDPIEYVHSSQKSLITQRQVKRDSQSFNKALRAALREDPDILLVGEMRDLETIRLALTAAETGHLVMATLHTSSAPRTINRIIDAFPLDEKNMIRNILSESMQAVICQKLVRKKQGGRLGAFEIMIGTSAIRNLIREDKIAQMVTALQTGHASGMCTMEQYLNKLGSKNLIC